MSDTTNNSPQVSVKEYSFTHFFGNTQGEILPLAIDSYQRPYVWTVGKVRELLDDLRDYQKSEPKVAYYLGTLLLHQKEGKHYIIDGQQRLTTLCILYYALHEAMPNADKTAEMQYHSPISVKHIRENLQTIQSYPNKDSLKDIFDKLYFTVVITESEDLAFTFFDTQNNRGVRLSPTDLLKAYHLRAIPSTNLPIQELCARKWESIQTMHNTENTKKDFAKQILEETIWRVRAWRGKDIREYRPSHEAILAEFEENSLPASASLTEVPLYATYHNRQAGKIELRSENEYVLHSLPIEIRQDKAYLPFALRQPLTQGVGFFLFVEKYAHLHHQLFHSKEAHLKNFLEVYQKIYKHISLYLREFFELASMAYYDKFGSEKLWDFALWLDHILGAIRLEKSSVYKEAVMNFLKDSTQNLLDVISQAFLPLEVIQYLRKVAKNEPYDNAKVHKYEGVRGEYRDKVLAYYAKGQGNNMQGKMQWIEEKLNSQNTQNND